LKLLGITKLDSVFSYAYKNVKLALSWLLPVVYSANCYQYYVISNVNILITIFLNLLRQSLSQTRVTTL